MALLATGVLGRVPAGLRAAVAMRDLTSTAYVSNSSHRDSGVPVSQRPGETVAVKRARLLYQSRKRGTLENGLLLSRFAAEYLPKLSPDQLDQYDDIINTPDDDWQIYYWITGRESPPPEYNTEVLGMMQVYAQASDKHRQNSQPSITKHDIFTEKS